MPLNNKRKQAIKRDIEDTAQDLDLKQQQQYKDAAYKIAFNLNQGIEEVLAQYRADAMPFIVEIAPTRPDKNHEAIEDSCSKLKKLYQSIYDVLITLGANSGVKVAAIEAIKNGLPLVQQASIEQDILIGKVMLGLLEQ